MNAIKLSNVIRERASLLRECDGCHQDDADLLRVLAHVVEGMEVERALGSPGDWGYDTPIGKALAQSGGAQ